jgi:hypothetical protein
MNSTSQSVTEGGRGAAFDQIPEIFLSVVDLVKAGGNGLAAIVFVSTLIVFLASLLFGNRLNDGMLNLVRWYLVTGAVCAALSLGAGMVERYFGASYDVHVTLSPALDIRGYPEPVVRADAVEVPLRQKFKIGRSMGIDVVMDGTLQYVEDLARSRLVAEQAATVCATTVERQNIQLIAAKTGIENLKTSLSQAAILPEWATTQFETIGNKLDWSEFQTPERVIVRNDLQFDPGLLVAPESVEQRAFPG